MRLKNYQEDVVFRAIEIALEDQQDLLFDESFVNDVAAYVLNRVPPRYVMSERGFLRLALEHSDEGDQDRSLANVIELMMLVNRGVEIVGSRRSAESRERAAVAGPPDSQPGPGIERELFVEPGLEYVHNYPQIIGRLVDAGTGNPVVDATVTMFIDGDPVPPAANGWQNPYVTREQTNGHFSFWPRAAKSEEVELHGQMLFTVDHPAYEPFSHAEPVTTHGAFDAARTISGDRIVSLRTFGLTRRATGEGSAL